MTEIPSVADVLRWQRAYIDTHPETGTDELLDATEAAVASPATQVEASPAWELRVRVTAPTPEDAERWTGGIADLVRAEFGDSMRLDITAGPVRP